MSKCVNHYEKMKKNSGREKIIKDRPDVIFRVKNNERTNYRTKDYYNKSQNKNYQKGNSSGGKLNNNWRKQTGQDKTREDKGRKETA